MSFLRKLLKKHREMSSRENIFTLGIYRGRKDYDIYAGSMPMERIVEIVQQRAEEDGEWCIKNNLIGNNEPKMRRMMSYVSNPSNIKRCIKYTSMAHPLLSIDFICRDLANTSRLAC